MRWHATDTRASAARAHQHASSPAHRQTSTSQLQQTASMALARQQYAARRGALRNVSPQAPSAGPAVAGQGERE
eukprot:6954029-Alexandrium_andersonii.AAC.1